MDESGDRRNVFLYCLKRLVLLIMIGDFQNGGNFPSVPNFQFLTFYGGPKNQSIAVSTAEAAADAFVVETSISPLWSNLLRSCGSSFSMRRAYSKCSLKRPLA